MRNKIKSDRYIKLESVGSYLDVKTGYTFPELSNGKRDNDEDSAIHITDCSEEWIESLQGFDKSIVGIWFKNNGELY